MSPVADLKQKLIITPEFDRWFSHDCYK